MTAIVMNTLNAAVTQYGASFAFNSITPARAAGGGHIYDLAGDTDAGVAIEAKWLGPQLGDLAVRRPDRIYAEVRGPQGSAGRARIVAGGKTVVRGTEWQYDVAVQSSGVSRSTNPGAGIRENYLAYGYVNVAGASYIISLFQVSEVLSNQRKVA